MSEYLFWLLLLQDSTRQSRCLPSSSTDYNSVCVLHDRRDEGQGWEHSVWSKMITGVSVRSTRRMFTVLNNVGFPLNRSRDDRREVGPLRT